MNNALSKEFIVLQRCAVCKIDLKGRFAFIDEEFLELTGYTYEELLGKPLSGVLDSAGQHLINQLLSERSHYETVYDSAPMTFIDKNRQPIRVTVIMFLNFIGGNPVNFQLIITSQAIPQRAGVP
ncbi:MAG: PAS domain-containing protein, partial [Candidatus Zixiibacteriota bacterium]